MKILVVDDELVSRKKMEKIMEAAGECMVAENGAEAISAFKEAIEKGSPFDLISLDITMPDMSGIEALDAIRSFEEKKDIPRADAVKIMMVTSHSDQDSVVASLKAGCNNYIVKPFDKARVFSKLQALGFDVKE